MAFHGPRGQNTLPVGFKKLRSGFTDEPPCGQVLGVRIIYRTEEEFLADFLYYELVDCSIMHDIAHGKFASFIVVIEVVDRTLLFPTTVGY